MPRNHKTIVKIAPHLLDSELDKLEACLHKSGVTLKLFAGRIADGWNITQAATTPPHNSHPYIYKIYLGKQFKFIAKSTGIVAKWLSAQTGCNITKNMIIGKFARAKTKSIQIREYIIKQEKKDN